jgi:hypothetical protein
LIALGCRVRQMDDRRLEIIAAASLLLERI